ncbi:hypothetical protein GJ496_000438 [Pomphorhynchus laevis]|nr:hypothetical protein GJ496_000438 [Pomphorhynchus laevis]
MQGKHVAQQALLQNYCTNQDCMIEIEQENNMTQSSINNSPTTSKLPPLQHHHHSNLLMSDKRCSNSWRNMFLTKQLSKQIIQIYICQYGLVTKKVKLKDAFLKQIILDSDDIPDSIKINLDDFLFYYAKSRTQFSCDTPVWNMQEHCVIIINKESFRLHEFKRSYFSITNCDVCNKLLIAGLRCNYCNVKSHNGCSRKANKLYCIRHIDRIFSGWKRTKLSKIHDHLNKRATTPTVLFKGFFSNSCVLPSNKQETRVCSLTSLRDLRLLSDEVDNDLANTLKIDTLTISTSLKSSSQPSSPRYQKRLRQNGNSLKKVSLWEISRDDIIKRYRKVGSGSFGTVYESELVNHGKVAIKELNISQFGSDKWEAFKAEVLALKKCRHKNIISFLGYIPKPMLAIVTEWCSGSSLYKHIHIMETKWSNTIIVNLCKQISQAMCYMHSRQIIHRDLKSNSILFSLSDIFLQNHQYWLVKIGDMGLARMADSLKTDSNPLNPTGSILWMAPEVIRMDVKDPYTCWSDIYAFGVILFEIGSQSLPYESMELSRDQILFLVGIGRLRLNVNLIKSNFPKLLKNLVFECCQFERERRCLFQTILNSLEQLYNDIPKIQRSCSIPSKLYSTRNSNCERFE